MKNAFPPDYYRGRTARDEGKPKIAPASSTKPNQAWWLGGWNDRDMELVEAQRERR